MGLHARLAGFYFWYFGFIGLWAPYWSLYLKDLGFSPARIGELLALSHVVRLIAPTFWGWLADRSGRRMALVRGVCLAALLSLTGLYVVGTNYAGVALILVLFGVFWNAALPQFEAVTLNHLGQASHRYSRIRLWGSVGFIVTAVGGGRLLEQYGVGQLPGVLLTVLLLVWLISLWIPDKPGSHPTGSAAPLGPVLRQRQVIALLVVVCLMQASFGPFYAFFTIYLQALGYSGDLIGGLWSLGVVAEIVVFWWMPTLMPRFGVQRLLAWTLLLTAVRWLLTGYAAHSLPLLLLAQTLHAFSFGVFHACTIELIRQYFPGALAGRGQALYSSLSMGLGGALGTLLAGYLWAVVGPGPSYAVSAMLCLLAWLLVLGWGTAEQRRLT